MFPLPPDQTIFSAGAQAISACFQNRNRRPTLRRSHAPRGSIMTIPRGGLAGISLLALLLIGEIWSARAQSVAREQDIVNLRLGQRVLVDDGTCPPGQIKQVSGAKMTPKGVSATRKCVPRLGPKKKEH
jgi:hypothetical protein